MLCSSTILLAVSLQSKLACTLTLRLGALPTLAGGGASMDFTDQSWHIGEAEGALNAVHLACLPTVTGGRLQGYGAMHLQGYSIH